MAEPKRNYKRDIYPSFHLSPGQIEEQRLKSGYYLEPEELTQIMHQPEQKEDDAPPQINYSLRSIKKPDHTIRGSNDPPTNGEYDDIHFQEFVPTVISTPEEQIGSMAQPLPNQEQAGIAVVLTPSVLNDPFEMRRTPGKEVKRRQRRAATPGMDMAKALKVLGEGEKLMCSNSDYYQQVHGAASICLPEDNRQEYTLQPLNTHIKLQEPNINLQINTDIPPSAAFLNNPQQLTGINIFQQQQAGSSTGGLPQSNIAFKQPQAGSSTDRQPQSNIAFKQPQAGSSNGVQPQSNIAFKQQQAGSSTGWQPQSNIAFKQPQAGSSTGRQPQSNIAFKQPQAGSSNGVQPQSNIAFKQQQAGISTGGQPQSNIAFKQQQAGSSTGWQPHSNIAFKQPQAGSSTGGQPQSNIAFTQQQAGISTGGQPQSNIAFKQQQAGISTGGQPQSNIAFKQQQAGSSSVGQQQPKRNYKQQQAGNSTEGQQQQPNVNFNQEQVGRISGVQPRPNMNFHHQPALNAYMATASAPARRMTAPVQLPVRHPCLVQFQPNYTQRDCYPHYGQYPQSYPMYRPQEQVYQYQQPGQQENEQMPMYPEGTGFPYSVYRGQPQMYEEPRQMYE